MQNSPGNTESVQYLNVDTINMRKKKKKYVLQMFHDFHFLFKKNVSTHLALHCFKSTLSTWISTWTKLVIALFENDS